MGIKAGPREKHLATWHLEFIAHWFLDNDQAIKTFNQEEMLHVDINGRVFNVTRILEAKPDFEQIHFDEQQLDKYLAIIPEEVRKLQVPWCNGLHPAERLAINLWTRGNRFTIEYLSFRSMQDFLRQHGRNTYTKCVNFILLNICIASQGLKKLKTQPFFQGEVILYRGEEAHSWNAYIKKRTTHADAKKPIKMQGFFASSTDHNTVTTFSQMNRHVVRIHCQNSDISKISEVSDIREEEVLFPPNQEFKIIKGQITTWRLVDYLLGVKTQIWDAWPIRSINSENEPARNNYIKNFNLTETKLIYQDIIKLKLKNLLNYLIQEKISNTHGPVRRFFDKVDNVAKLQCIQKIISLLDSLLKEPCISNKQINLLIDTINQSLNENKRISHESKALPGKVNKILLISLDKINLIKAIPNDNLFEDLSDLLQKKIGLFLTPNDRMSLAETSHTFLSKPQLGV